MTLQIVLQKINPKKLFLADAIGAAFSAFMLGIVLANLEAIFGVDQQALYVLAIIPCIFAVYSFICFARFPQNWRVYMQIIAFANLLYCIASNIWSIFFADNITILGILYFVLELIVVSTLAVIELKTAARK